MHLSSANNSQVDSTGEKIVAHYVMYKYDFFLEESIESVYPFVDKILIARTLTPWNGKKADLTETNRILEKIVLKYSDKVEIFADSFPNEHTQRNFLIEKSKSRGHKGAFIIDCDEIFLGDSFKNIYNFIVNNRPNALKIPYLTFIKDASFVISPPYETSLFYIDLTGDIKFVSARQTNSKEMIMPYSEPEILHFSYIREKDSDILQKVNSFMHFDDTDWDRWYREVYIGFHPRLKNFHPVWPENWSGLQYFDSSRFPERLLNKLLKYKKIIFNRFIKDKDTIKLHLGCGNKVLEGYINIDLYSDLADLKLDITSLKYFEDDSVDEIYMNAVFEHIYTFEQIPALKEWFRILKPSGILRIDSIPDFDAIVKAYINHEKGNSKEIFDLYEVSRYTHGDYNELNRFGQIHKDIFTVDKVKRLLEEAGFKIGNIESKCWLDEPNPVNINVLALKPDVCINEETIQNNQLDKHLRNDHILTYEKRNELFNKKTIVCSIIIPVFNKVEYTMGCLNSIVKNYSQIGFEIIIINNASTDETTNLLNKYPYPIIIINNEKNVGYTIAYNQGALIAKGKYLVFLNNDTSPQKNWLDELVSLAESDNSIGAIGAKLIYPNGTIQEAGGLIFSDGNGWNFGNGDNPLEEKYNKICEVDYCSAACLLVRHDLFNEIGGFDERYAPAYYEDSDLCFEIRQRGYKVLFNPKSEVIHYESITAGKEIQSGFKKFIPINRWKFIDKWKNELVYQDDPPEVTGKPITADRNRLLHKSALPAYLYYSKHIFTEKGYQKKIKLDHEINKIKVLFFFPHNPIPIKTGAHRNTLEIMKGLQKLGCEVTLFSSNIFTDNVWTDDALKILNDEFYIDSVIYLGTPDDQKYINYKNLPANLVNWESFLPLGLMNSFYKFYKFYQPDVVFINYSYWGNILSKNDYNSLTVIETHDLVSLNIKLKNELLSKLQLKDYELLLNNVDESVLKENFFDKLRLEPDEEELKICDKFDYTLTVSPAESDIIKQNTKSTDVLYIPVTISNLSLNSNYEGKPIFVISNNPFNIQGYLYFVKKVMPEILKKRNDFKLNVIGDACKNIPSANNINLFGYVDDLSAYYNTAPFAICPLIGGTGQQVKIVEAMANGLPVIALENIGKNSPILHGINGYIAKDYKEFAEYCILLYEDRGLCKKLGWAAYNTINEKYSDSSLLNALTKIVTVARKSSNKKIKKLDIDKIENFFSNFYPKNILFIRTDSIGDNILASSLFEALKNKFSNSDLTVLCQEHVAELYKYSPYIKNVITIDKQRIYVDESYRNNVLVNIRKMEFDTVINSVFSSEKITDLLAVATGAEKILRIDGNLENSTLEWVNEARKLSSFLIETGSGWLSELTRYENFLKGIGANFEKLKPEIWLSNVEEKFAEKFFDDNKLDPEKTIVLFANASNAQRLYDNYGKALSDICSVNGFNVIAVGSDKDFEINQKNLNDIRAKTINLSGKTTILQTAAIIKRCKLAVGAETGNAHISCAVGTPNVIIIGGGHFGRFMPYSKLTSLVMLPLSCYGCNWKCKFEKPYCVKEIDTILLSTAIENALKTQSIKPRVYFNGLRNNESKQKLLKMFDRFIEIDKVEIVEVKKNEILPYNEKIISLSEEAIQANQFKTARGLLENILNFDPLNIDALNNIAVMEIMSGNLQAGFNYLKKILSIDPNNVVAQNNSRFISEKFNTSLGENNAVNLIEVNNL